MTIYQSITGHVYSLIYSLIHSLIQGDVEMPDSSFWSTQRKSIFEVSKGNPCNTRRTFKPHTQRGGGVIWAPLQGWGCEASVLYH